MKKIIWLAAVMAVSITVFAQTSVTGYVFADANGNGKKDKKEKGIAGVAVSNGKDVTTTDAQGSYRLGIDGDDIIFVIKPSGYQLPVNEKKLPQFYYNHKPAGSPTGFQYKGVQPTGPLPALVNFALIAVAETNDFTSLIFGDPQPYTQKEVDFFSKGIVAEVAGISNISFGLSLGDLVGDNLTLHNPYIDAVQKVGIPWFNVMGNHDMNYEATADSLSDETFEASFGPANYSFNYGKVHFIILDDILYPDPRDAKGYWGGFTDEQLLFLENDLKLVPKDHLIVLSFHIPLQMYDGVYRKKDRDQLFYLLKDFPHTLSLSAHTHLQRNDFYDKKDGWLQDKPHHEYNAGTTSGDWYSGEMNEQAVPVSTMRDGTPKGYAFIHFNGNEYMIDYKVAGKDAAYQIALYAPKVIPNKRPGSAAMYANFFMGKKGDKVEYRIDETEWKKMNYTEDADPSFIAALIKWDFTETLIPGRRPSAPEKSTHLWEAKFPNNLTVGPHRIEVRATDMFGRTFTSTKSFKVQEAIILP